MTHIDRNVVSVAKNARQTSRDAAEKVLPKTGSMRRLIYDLIEQEGGLTDYEIENLTRLSHQTASASRRSLVIDNLLEDSGQTRTNKNGNQCTVWITTGKDWTLL